MRNGRMTKEEAVQSVLDGLQALIAAGASATVNREFNPTSDPDSDDDYVAAGRSQLRFLRDMRAQFENVLLLGEFPLPSVTDERLEEWLDTPQEALDNHTPRQMGLKAP
jgi:hypothetical protein